MKERLIATTSEGATMVARAGFDEPMKIEGCFDIACYESEGGPLLWQETIANVVTTLGKNLMLDTTLAGSAYTVVGPYIGLISSTSFSATAASDTMASHAGWLEAGSAN